MAKDISKAYGSNIVFAGVNLAIDKGSRVVILGYNGAGKTTTLRLLATHAQDATRFRGIRSRLQDRLLRAGARHLGSERHRVGEPAACAPELDNTQARSILGSFLFSGDDAMKPAHVLSGGEKTRLALATLVTSRATCCCSTSPPTTSTPLPVRRF